MKKGFGAALDALAAERGLTHRALGRAAGVSQSVVSRIVREERLHITTETYFSLCAALGVPCTHFAEWVDMTLPATPPASEAEPPAELAPRPAKKREPKPPEPPVEPPKRKKK